MEPPVVERFMVPREQKSNFGFAVWKAIPRVMEEGHQHNDIEVNYLLSGRMVYLRGGRRETEVVNEGELAIFWAGQVHRVIETDPSSYFCGISLPLSWFLGWNLPSEFVRPLLHGRLLRVSLDDQVRELRGRVDQWLTDLDEDTAIRRRAMLLEIEGWFHRAAMRPLSVDEEVPAPPQGKRHRASVHKAEEMVSYIVNRYTDPISVREVAEAVGLHPSYAVNLFRQVTGYTLMDFITKQRVANAQLRLATTEDRVIDIALEAGFGSLSRFHVAFKREFGLTPVEYRVKLNTPRAW